MNSSSQQVPLFTREEHITGSQKPSNVPTVSAGEVTVQRQLQQDVLGAGMILDFRR